MPLFDAGRVAIDTRAAAYQDAKPKLTERQGIILDFLELRGAEGATRHEIADALGFPLSSACAPVLGLLRVQMVVERGTRLSPYGKPAAVVMLAEVVQ